MIPNNIRHKVKQRHTFINSILSPLSNNQEWHNVEVITLKQSAIDKATDYVLDRVVDMTDVNTQIANALSSTKYRINREFVDITEDKITIAVQADIVNDGVVDKAMEMLMEIPNYSIGTFYSGPEHSIEFCCADTTFAV